MREIRVKGTETGRRGPKRLDNGHIGTEALYKRSDRMVIGVPKGR